MLARDPVEKYFVETSPFAAADEQVQWEQVAYDRVSQVNSIEWTLPKPEGQDKIIRLRLRQFFPQELSALLHYNGFEIIKQWGDFEGNVLEDKHLKQVILCQPRPQVKEE